MKKITKVATAIAAIAAATSLAGTAQAAEGNPDGKFQVKLLATGVITDGSVKEIKSDAAHLVSSGALTNTATSDNYVPTIALEYFVTPNISIETICCTTAHHVTATAGAVKGTPLVNNVTIIPATFTAKYHLPVGHGIKPYVGVGPTLFIVLSDDPSNELRSIGVTRTKLSSEFGVAAQAGVDIALGKGYGFSLDAKKYWVSTNATVYAGNAVALVSRTKLDPWVLSAGVSYRF